MAQSGQRRSCKPNAELGSYVWNPEDPALPNPYLAESLRPSAHRVRDACAGRHVLHAAPRQGLAVAHAVRVRQLAVQHLW